MIYHSILQRIWVCVVFYLGIWGSGQLAWYILSGHLATHYSAGDCSPKAAFRVSVVFAIMQFRMVGIKGIDQHCFLKIKKRKLFRSDDVLPVATKTFVATYHHCAQADFKSTKGMSFIFTSRHILVWSPAMLECSRCKSRARVCKSTVARYFIWASGHAPRATGGCGSSSWLHMLHIVPCALCLVVHLPSYTCCCTKCFYVEV